MFEGGFLNLNIKFHNNASTLSAFLLVNSAGTYKTLLTLQN